MKNNKNSVQGLIGFERFSRFGVKTDKAEIAFFSVEPTNISVLSAANIDVKIHHLMMLLSTIPDLEILALDSCECFDTNKVYVKKRLQTEQNEAVRKLLQADYDFLDEIQVGNREPLYPPVVGYAEIARMTGVTRQRAYAFPRIDSFPKPVIETSQGPLYSEDAVRAWAQTRELRPGRPKAME